jgi:hypothetical protein
MRIVKWRPHILVLIIPVNLAWTTAPPLLCQLDVADPRVRPTGRVDLEFTECQHPRVPFVRIRILCDVCLKGIPGRIQAGCHKDGYAKGQSRMLAHVTHRIEFRRHRVSLTGQSPRSHPASTFQRRSPPRRYLSAGAAG